MHAQLNLADSAQPSEQVSVSLGEKNYAVTEASMVVPNDALVALGRNDASLNDLAFISEDRMAAVGDRGMVLVSNNSGRTWETAESLTTANLYAVLPPKRNRLPAKCVTRKPISAKPVSATSVFFRMEFMPLPPTEGFGLDVVAKARSSF